MHNPRNTGVKVDKKILKKVKDDAKKDRRIRGLYLADNDIIERTYQKRMERGSMSMDSVWKFINVFGIDPRKK